MEKLIIIGGGSAGLAGAIYASRALLNPILFEGIPGGQLGLTSDVENYPGFENPILGPILMQQFRNQALRFGTRIVSQKIKEVKTSSVIKVMTETDEEYETEALLIATGAEPKWLGLQSEQRLRGHGVSACATCDGFFFKDKDVVVVGGGDSAMEEALYLTKFAKSITVIHRRDTFKASKIMQERVLIHPQIKVMWNTTVQEVLGEDKVEALKTITNGQEQKINTQGLFLAIGHVPATTFLADSGVQLDEKGYIYTKERVMYENIEQIKSGYTLPYRFSTNIKGVFAAGDCVDYTYRQAATASGMAVSAVLEVEKYLQEA